MGHLDSFHCRQKGFEGSAPAIPPSPGTPSAGIGGPHQLEWVGTIRRNGWAPSVGIRTRFIEETDSLSLLDQRPNLMDMTPGEFEALISNLFRKMGLETRLTQASRDGGVDCVAYDTRPILGGKVVIQAKRYKNTVGVSAVRPEASKGSE